jgi:phage gp36-like protein
MPYSTLQDVQSEIGSDVLVEITDTTDAGVVDETVVASAIERADAIINGYLSWRVAVPVSPVTDTLTELSVDIAIYTLFSRREVVPEFREKRYRSAISFLIAFSKGEVGLGMVVGASPDSSLMAPITGSPVQIFTDTVLDKF